MNIQRIMKLWKNFFTDKYLRFAYLSKLGFYNYMPDEKYLKRKFKLIMGKELNLENPKTLNEKLQWLKINYRKPELTNLVDKYEVKKFISDKLGEEYVIPILGIWESADEIDFDTLPAQFVLKCTHDSGRVIVCQDKTKMDIKKVKRKIKENLKRNYYYSGREWPYKNVTPKVFAEKYITDSPESRNLTDYKFYCFSGKADCVLVCLDRSSGDTKYYFFDRDWNLKRYNTRGMKAPENFTIPKPKFMDEMFDIAEKLSAEFPFVRVDMYCTEEHIYFGEYTFFPNSGFDCNRLPESDRMFGDMVNISV